MRDLTPEEQETTLEDLLTESETLYGHKRNMVQHARNPLLHRYLYVYSNSGKKSQEMHMKEDKFSSSAEIAKSKLGLMLTDEVPGNAAPEATASYQKFTSLTTQLKKKKMALSKLCDAFDEMLLFLPALGGDKPEVEERLTALHAAAKNTRDKLNEVRVVIAQSSQKKKKTDECEDVNLARETLLQGCAAACEELSKELDLCKRLKVSA